MTSLDDDYKGAGFSGRLGFGERPALVVIDFCEAYLDPSAPLYAGVEDARESAVRVLEAGKDLYDPVLYLPAEDVTPRLRRDTAQSSHCPLKGDAAYFDLVDAEGAVQVPKIAWSYPEPPAFASDLAGRVAFYAKHVTIEDSPL